MDLSDTTGHSVPLPPPVREQTRTGHEQKPAEVLKQAENEEKADLGSFRLDDEPLHKTIEQPLSKAPSSPVTSQPMSFTEEIDETQVSKADPLPADFSLDMGQEPSEPVNPPIQTSNLKGKKAFQTPMEPTVPRRPDLPSNDDKSVLEEFKGDVADIRLEIARQMREHLPQLVRESVESYCAIHFPKIAREIVTNELRRLADEKARHLIDN
jgi:hypothetical protein